MKLVDSNYYVVKVWKEAGGGYAVWRAVQMCRLGPTGAITGKYFMWLRPGDEERCPRDWALKVLRCVRLPRK
jgi:hypothetical protein